MKKALTLALAAVMALVILAPSAQAGERNQYKPKSPDRPYGRSLDNDYQKDFHAKKRTTGKSLFTQDLHEDEVFYQKRTDGFDDDRSYMVPERKKTIPTWGETR
jgi:Ni/Co efflux regulator RcnB